MHSYRDLDMFFGGDSQRVARFVCGGFVKFCAKISQMVGFCEV